MLARSRSFVRRHPLAVFVTLAYGLSWLPWLWSPGGLLPAGPFLAALLVFALVGGRPAVTAWLRKIAHWRVGARWYALVLLGPPALTFAAVGLTVATGATPLPGSTTPGVAALAGQFVVVLAWVGLGEEPAWRGCALPMLLPGRSAVGAALLVGLIHAGLAPAAVRRRVRPRQRRPLGAQRPVPIDRHRVDVAAHGREPAAADAAARRHQHRDVRLGLVRGRGPAAAVVDLDRALGGGRCRGRLGHRARADPPRHPDPPSRHQRSIEPAPRRRRRGSRQGLRCPDSRWPTRSRRLRTPTLSNTDLRWSCTVCVEMCSEFEIALVESPRSTSRATSSSRVVSP